MRTSTNGANAILPCDGVWGVLSFFCRSKKQVCASGSLSVVLPLVAIVTTIGNVSMLTGFALALGRGLNLHRLFQCYAMHSEEKKAHKGFVHY
eukprot:2213911-Amphidinium_carterae.1